jgi:hypothetical protein
LDRQNRSDDWTGFHELLANNVDAKVHSFDRAYSEKDEIVTFGENHIVCRGKTSCVNNRISHFALD